MADRRPALRELQHRAGGAIVPRDAGSIAESDLHALTVRVTTAALGPHDGVLLGRRHVVTDLVYLLALDDSDADGSAS
jgi:hypothetical protein